MSEQKSEQKSEQQPEPAFDLNSFAAWYFHKDNLAAATKHTVEMLFKTANYSDDNDYCLNEGIRLVSTKDNLSVAGKHLSDLTPFQSLTHLIQVYLQNNQISELSPLRFLTNSIVLNLNSNQISNLVPLQSLNRMMTLHLRDNQISDISPLQSLTNLRYLDLCCNQISDISPLQSLTNLQKLFLENNPISDLRPLLYINRLTDFKISFTPEHQAIIENSRRKWETLANSTKQIDRAQATAAINAAYKSLGLAAPEIVFCDSLTAGFAQLHMRKQSLKNIRWFDRLDNIVRNVLRPITLMTELQQKLVGLVVRWEEQLFQKVRENVSDSWGYSGYWDYSRAIVTRKYLVESLILLDFYVLNLGVTLTPESLQLVQALMRLLAECGWLLACENVCVACARPTKLCVDGESLLHAVGESAIEFADGCKLYS